MGSVSQRDQRFIADAQDFSIERDLAGAECVKQIFEFVGGAAEMSQTFSRGGGFETVYGAEE